MNPVVSKAWCVSFVVLIVLPITAPFQTVSVAELLHGHGHQTLVVGSPARLSPSPIETMVSPDPPFDGTGARLKLESRSVCETLNDFATRRSGFITRFALADAGTAHAPSAILRL